MPRLTTAQLREIQRHRIPLSKVFDATGLTRQQAIKAMSVEKEIVMVNGLACRNDATHVLRTRYGHCVECNPAGISMQARKSATGYAYLAGSKRTGLLKIGMATDPQQREAVLNSLGYGGASDWTILAIVKTERAGLIEHEVQRALALYQVEASYFKDGRKQSCYEIFRCRHETALSALRSAAMSNSGVLTYEAPPNGQYGVSCDDTTQRVTSSATSLPEDNENCKLSSKLEPTLHLKNSDYTESQVEKPKNEAKVYVSTFIIFSVLLVAIVIGVLIL